MENLIPHRVLVPCEPQSGTPGSCGRCFHRCHLQEPPRAWGAGWPQRCYRCSSPASRWQPSESLGGEKNHEATGPGRAWAPHPSLASKASSHSKTCITGLPTWQHIRNFWGRMLKTDAWTHSRHSASEFWKRGPGNIYFKHTP